MGTEFMPGPSTSRLEAAAPDVDVSAQALACISGHEARRDQPGQHRVAGAGRVDLPREGTLG